jgi:predicted acyltransferase
LFMYVLGAFLAILIGNIPVVFQPEVVKLKGFIYNDLLLTWLPENWASLAFAIFFVLFNWIFGHILYKKRIFIKI